jgi:hypothetical protein
LNPPASFELCFVTTKGGRYESQGNGGKMVELVSLDERGKVVLTLRWKRNSREVCYRFVDSKIAKASFKVLASDFWGGDIWENLGI